jgi:hypothetical protein
VLGDLSTGNHVIEYIFWVFVPHDSSDDFLTRRPFRRDSCGNLTQPANKTGNRTIGSNPTFSAK